MTERSGVVGRAPMTGVTRLHDGWVVAKRNLTKIKRVPDLLVFSTIEPIMFVLLFAYVFGSAIAVPGVNYKEFLMPGIFVQTVAFGAASPRSVSPTTCRKVSSIDFGHCRCLGRRCWSGGPPLI